MDGFGRWEFLGLMGGILSYEARDVHSTFLNRWDFENVDDRNFQAVDDAER